MHTTYEWEMELARERSFSEAMREAEEQEEHEASPDPETPSHRTTDDQWWEEPELPITIPGESPASRG